MSQNPPAADSVSAPPRGSSAASRTGLLALAAGLLADPTPKRRSDQADAVNAALDWLEGFPGDCWQDRWQLSGAEEAGTAWGPPGLPAARRMRLTSGLGILIALRAVRPCYAWLFGSRLLGVYDSFRRNHEPQVFERARGYLAEQGICGEYAQAALNVLVRLSIVTGRDLLDLEIDDIEDYGRARRAGGRPLDALPLAYQALHAAGGLAGAPPTLRLAHMAGPLPPAGLVDRYPVADQGVRDLLIAYFTERSAVLDYSSLVNQSQMLVNLFWVDLELHHPGISSLRLPDEVALAWKQRVRVLADGRPRLNSHAVLLAVRSFYLDLHQWALEDPGRWALWAAPCPIRGADVRGYPKENRRREARMAQRTRTLTPVLPALVAAAEEHLRRATLVRDAARAASPGEAFTVEGAGYRRSGRPGNRFAPAAPFVTTVTDSGPGSRFDAERHEDNAFWTWAIIEVLRRTGVRVEELLELTHLSLRQYRAPAGEMVPLLQISPSKTDRERVIPADPDLVAVLARVLRRIKGPDGRVLLLARYDTHERVAGPPLPHLFQRVFQHHRQVISPGRVRRLLADLADRMGVVDVDGTPLAFTPHDFRRIFSTEAVNGGLPIHIAAKLLGHIDLNTTQGYVAVYPEEVIRHYRNFVEHRRDHRPGEEYREPSDAEWQEFRDHFTLRKVALGTCDRPYGTPCQHEHACVRCPMLRMDLAQVPRLLDIEANTIGRLDEARRMTWLGEVAALEESLRHIAGKKKQAGRLQEQAARGDVHIEALA